jgi:multiple sugar transport system permease protein
MAAPPVATAAPVTRAARSTRGSGRPRREALLAWLLLAPAAAALLAFVVIPMLWGVAVSFQDRRLTGSDTEWVGLDNWSRLLEDGTLRATIGFTLLSTVVVVATSALLGVALAVALLDRPWLRRVVGTLVVLPIATSLVVSSAGWRLLFDIQGGLDQLLGAVGIDGPNWLNETAWAKLAIVVVGFWAQAGFALLLYQAALSQLPPSLVDAARVYGCWRGVRHKARLVLPLLHRTTAVVVIVSSIVALRTFDQVYTLTAGGPYGETRTLAFATWEQAFRFFDLGSAAVTSTLLVLLVLLVTAAEVLVLRRIARRAA